MSDGQARTLCLLQGQNTHKYRELKFCTVVSLRGHGAKVSSREQLRVDTEGKEKLFDRKSKSNKSLNFVFLLLFFLRFVFFG